MNVQQMLDVSAWDESWHHATARDADGLDLHYVKWGEGQPQVLLLHGWPGFWYDWRHVLPALAEFTSAIAPDLRGFGLSAKPDLPAPQAYSPEVQAKNVLALLDQLHIEQIVVVGYDVGSRVAQLLARTAPDRVRALVLSAPVYPGFGTRPLAPEMQPERWYQYFHQLPLADEIVSHDQETVRLYLSHFYDHWLGKKETLRPFEFEEIVKTYAQPGAVRGSIAWYRAGGGSSQLARASGNTTQDPITQPTTVLWGEIDPVLPAAWSDRLNESFSHLLGLRILPGVGHFVATEAPEAFVEAIRSVLAN
jgi:pimeloyl-ACP methyl ester carboxylesterase